MLTRGLGIPGRGAAGWQRSPAGPAALGVLSLATKSGRGGTTGRAAGWPASGRPREGAAERGGGRAIPGPAPRGAREPSGRWRGAIIGRCAGAAGRKPSRALRRASRRERLTRTGENLARPRRLARKGSPPGPAAVWLKEERDGPARRWPPGAVAGGDAAQRGVRRSALPPPADGSDVRPPAADGWARRGAAGRSAGGLSAAGAASGLGRDDAVPLVPPVRETVRLPQRGRLPPRPRVPRASEGSSSGTSNPYRRRSLMATSSSMELEWVFFSATPNSGSRSSIS